MEEFIHGYRALQKLGEGVSGEVFLSVLMERTKFGGLGDLVALKVLKEKFLEVPKQIERIHTELTAGTQIIHPNIIRIFDGSSDAPHLIS